MIKKLFGETEEEQFQYLRPRMIALAVAIVITIIGLLLSMFDFGMVLAGLGEAALVVTLLVFGWAIMRGLFGIASLGILFSNNVVLGVVIFVLYIMIGYLGGLVVAVIGLCRFLVLLKNRK